MDHPIYDRFKPGQFVELRAVPNVVWEIQTTEPYDARGPLATLKHVGGDRFTYAEACKIFRIHGPAARVCKFQDLIEANAMLVLAAVVQHR